MAALSNNTPVFVIGVAELATTGGPDRDPEHPFAVAKEWADELPNSHITQVTPRDVSRSRYDEEMRDAVAAHLNAALGRDERKRRHYGQGAHDAAEHPDH